MNIAIVEIRLESKINYLNVHYIAPIAILALKKAMNLLNPIYTYCITLSPCKPLHHTINTIVQIG